MAFEEVIEFIEKGSNKLQLEQGVVKKLKFLSAEVVTGKFGKQVKLEFIDLEDGERKKYYTASQRLLRKLFKELKIKENEVIYLRRSGDRFETVYEARRATITKEKREIADAEGKVKEASDRLKKTVGSGKAEKEPESADDEINLEDITF